MFLTDEQVNKWNINNNTTRPELGDEETFTFVEGKCTFSMGVTTAEEAKALEDKFTKMLHTTIHYNGENQQGPFPEYFGWYGLERFQCTWWANGRAQMYLAEYGTKYTKYPASGHGGSYYRNNIRSGMFAYGQTPKVNSIVCWGAGVEGNYGHVAFVEGVTEDGIWISHAGGGKCWNGVEFISDYKSVYGQTLNGFIYLDEPL